MDELKQIATRYLLGELSEQEQATLEEKYFRDPEVFNQVLQVESELVDAYARGTLSAEMREQFENSYLQHPSRRRRVEFAKALTTRIDEKEKLRTPVASAQSTSGVSWWQSLFATARGGTPKLRFAMAMVAVLMVLSVAWIVVNNLRQQHQSTPIQAQRQSDERHQQEQSGQPPQQTPKQDQERHTAQVPPPTLQPSPSPVTKSAPPIVSLAITVGGVRSSGSGPTQIFIPAETTHAQILLNLKDDSYPLYRVSLEKIGGQKIFTKTNKRPLATKAGARFVFTVPARKLTSGDYALTLTGITAQGEVDDLSKSLFRVEKP
jgi:hypothetical protein